MTTEDVKPVEVLFPLLQALMQRRHQIVHQADRVEGQDALRAMSVDDLLEWTRAVYEFANG